jgi:tetratricopeptide (TPR) repeat protein
MKAHLHKRWLALLGFALLGAASREDPEELVRRGNVAFTQGDFTAAVNLYAEAEDAILDPGLVAFNKATALYQLGRYREAELHYRRCWEDAEGVRRTRLLYNLGNCLLQQARGSDVARLREAIGLYEQCLQQEEAESELLADARHNLELARLLWIKAKNSKAGRNPSDEDPANEPNSPNDPRNDARLGGDERGLATPDPRGRPEPISDPQGDPKAAARTDERPPPGKGNLPPIPDVDDLVSLSPEDAAEHLKQELIRIRRERQEHRQQIVPAVSSHVKDW